jgi:hypothetical protein
MPDPKSLRLIGYGLSAVTMLVTMVAAVSVVDTTKAPATAPPTHAALRLEAAF